MINASLVLLIPTEDYSQHPLAKHVPVYMPDYPFNLYYIEPLKKLFSKVIVYDYIRRMTQIGVKAVNGEIIELVKKEHPKYLVWVTVHHEFLESTCDIVQKEGTKVVGIFFDDEWRFEEYSKWWAPRLDYCVTSAPDAVPKYKEQGGRVIYTAPCNGIPVERDWSKRKESYEVTFVGSKVADREQWITQLKSRNIPLQLFGLGWNRWIPFQDVLDVFATSKINLNFTRTHHGDKTGWKGRMFQVPLAGGFLLTEYTPDLENYFEIGKEIECFHDMDELLAKITYYLNHDDERRAIAQAGWRRATTQYTPFHMMERIFHEIENDIAMQGEKQIPERRHGRMPVQARKRFAEYYLNWGRAFLAENYNGLWRDALALSIRYYPFNGIAWYHYGIGFLPYPLRIAMVRFYRALRYWLGIIRYLLGLILHPRKR